MANQDTRNIGLRKNRLVRLAVGCALCAAFFFLMLSVLYLDREALETGRRTLRNPALVVAGATFGSMVFSAMSFLLVRKLLDQGPGVVLNAAGMLDNSSVMSAGFVPWSDITGVEICGISIFRGLVVRVADPDKYMLGGNVLTRHLRRSAMRSHGGPIFINAMYLNTSLIDLSRTIERYRARYGGQA